jgi:carboxylesterase type B
MAISQDLPLLCSLNVFTPRLAGGVGRAVLVYIHGGAFIMGGGASYFFGPNYLMEQVPCM